MRVLLPSLLIAATVAGCGPTFSIRPPMPEDEVARLKREITKVRFAVDSTKELIERARGQAYLPDLYMRLAELHVEEARYHYFIAYEGQKKRSRAVVSVQARLLKNKAVEVYKRILDEFPTYQDSDKVKFFIAHEYRELGEYDTMIGYLNQVVTEHPNSGFRNEALLVLGDHYFDQSELKQAEKYYKQILATPESDSHGMARYKLGWVRINEEKFKDALKLFEDTIEGLEKHRKGKNKLPRGGEKLDLRREALVDLVFPYTEVNKKAAAEDSLTYFRRLADSRTTYLAALNKLAKRWFVKGRYNVASGIYRELLALGADDEDSIEWARRLYDGAVKGRQFEYVATDVGILSDILERRYYDWRLTEQEREQAYKEFEAYTRDLSTKAQLAAKEKKDKKLYSLVADAYETYLRVFSEAEAVNEIAQNMAEARLEAEEWLQAGVAFESITDRVGEKEKKDVIYNAVVAYDRALKKAAELSRLDRVRARAGLRKSAQRYVTLYPKEREMVAIKFNYAKSFYDEGLFEEAAELFSALVEEFPTSSEAAVSAELALDSLRVREDFEEMARLGQRFTGNQSLPGEVRGQLAEIVKSAEAQALDKATLDAGTGGDAAVESLLAFAARHKGSALGEKALINAFATAQNSDDFEQVAKIGERILQDYPGSKIGQDVLATLGKMSAQATDFERAAGYLERAAQNSKGADRVELLKAAAGLQAGLGDMEAAKRTYQEILKAADGPSRRDAAMALADLMEQSGDYAEMARALSVAASVQGSAAVEFRLGYALMKAGRGSDAQRHFQAAVQQGSGSGNPEELEGVAGAAFFLGESVYKAFERVGYQGGTIQAVQNKFAALQEFEGAMSAVLDTGDPRWSLAALARMAAAYENAADFIEKAPPPTGLSGAAADQVKEALTMRMHEQRASAKDVLEACAAKAAEIKVFTAAAKACNAGQALTGDPEGREMPKGRAGSPPAGQVNALRQQIAKNSKDYQALARLATLYLQAGDPFGARLVLDKASEGGANAETYNLRAVVMFKLGFPQAAFEDLRLALEQDGSDARARLNLAALYRAYNYKTLADAERAKVRSTRGLDFQGDPSFLPGAGAQ